MNKEEAEEFKRLEKKNKDIKRKIDSIIGRKHPLYSPLWVAIFELIENEIEQEEFCSQ